MNVSEFSCFTHFLYARYVYNITYYLLYLLFTNTERATGPAETKAV